MANPAPVANGRCAPTMPWPPRKLTLLSKRCMEPPLPLDSPSRRPNSSAMTRLGAEPPPGSGPLGGPVPAPRRAPPDLPPRGHDGGGPPPPRFRADVEMENPADLAHGVHLGGLLLEASQQLHLRQQPPGQLHVEPGAGYRGFGLRHGATPASATARPPRGGGGAGIWRR